MKKNLLLLPGVLGTSKTMQPVKEALQAHFIIHTFNYQPLQVSLTTAQTYVTKFAKDVLVYLEEKQLENVILFGYSFGGLVAAQVALFNANSIEAIYAYGTLWKWNEDIAQRLLQYMDIEYIEQQMPEYAQLLQEWYEIEDWKMIIREEQKRTLFLGVHPPISTKHLAKISIPIHFRIGDQDRIIVQGHTEWAHQHTPNSSFRIIPNSKHPVSKINYDYLKEDICQLFCG